MQARLSVRKALKAEGSEHEAFDATSSYKYGPEECARPIPRLIPSLFPFSPSLSPSLSFCYLLDGNIARVRLFEGFCMLSDDRFAFIGRLCDLFVGLLNP